MVCLKNSVHKVPWLKPSFFLFELPLKKGGNLYGPNLQGWDSRSTTHPLRSCFRTLSGWWLSPTPLKNISQVGSLFPIYGKLRNHQPDID